MLLMCSTRISYSPVFPEMCSRNLEGTRSTVRTTCNTNSIFFLNFRRLIHEKFHEIAFVKDDFSICLQNTKLTVKLTSRVPIFFRNVIPFYAVSFSSSGAYCFLIHLKLRVSNEALIKRQVARTQRAQGEIVLEFSSSKTSAS